MKEEVVIDPPESEARRRLELRLFHQYLTETGPSICIDATSYEFWVTILSKLALKSDAILYSIYLISALHTETCSKSVDPEPIRNCQTYLNMALREHHKDIAQLSKDNVDYVCLTSSMLRIYGFVRLQSRVLLPYTPPTDWLRITGSSTVVFREAWDMAKQTPNCIAQRMIASVLDYLDDDEKLELRGDLTHLVRREEPHELEESWDPQVEEAYESALCFIGGICKAMDKRDPVGSVGRRIIVFPMLVNKRFADLVEEQRPRALVILAHYFALLSLLRGSWWIGNAGAREIHAIAEVVPAAWQASLNWPKQILEEQD